VTRFSASRWTRLAAFALILGAASLILYLFQNLWLPWIGEGLVSSDTPAPADLILVLGGDFWGPRVVKGAELAVRGYAPRVLISGPDYRWNGIIYPEGDLATQFLVDKGYPRKLFSTFHHHAGSTIDEAKALVPELQRLQVKRLLIVTSAYHSRRASLVFHALVPFSEIRVIGVPDGVFEPDSWWVTPGNRQLVKSEWTKVMGTIALSLLLRLEAIRST